MYYVYIVKCSDETLYTGYTTDIKNRLDKHNKGNGAKYTRGRGPVRLVYSEEFDNKVDALKREYQIKKFDRKNKLLLIEKVWLYESLLRKYN